MVDVVLDDVVVTDVVVASEVEVVVGSVVVTTQSTSWEQLPNTRQHEL